MVDIPAHLIPVHPRVEAAPGAAIWKRSVQRGQAFRPQRHAELVVLLATHGEASYLIDGEIVDLKRGTLLWALAGQAHFLVKDSADFDMWVLLVSDQVLTPDLRAAADMPPLTLADHNGPPHARILSTANLDVLTRLAEQVQSAPSAVVQRAGFQWWLAQAWAAWRDASKGTRRAVHPAVDRAVLTMQRDVTLSWDEVARDIPLSRGRLARLFKQQTGQTPLQFRNERRLQQIDAMLAAEHPPDLLTACLEVGFGSYSQFYRVFRDHRKMSPRSYYAPERHITSQ